MSRLVLLADYRTEAREVQLVPAAATALATYFEQQVAEFRALNALAYEPGYKPREDEALALPFALPAHLARYAESAPADAPVFDEHALRKALPKALVAVLYGEATCFAFQAIDRRNVLGLEQGRIGALLWGRERFSLTSEPVLIPNDGLDALHADGTLMFRNDWVVRRFVDMEPHFIEASDQDLTELFGSETFVVHDWPALRQAAGPMLRRRLSRLLTSGQTYALSKLKAAAVRAQLELTLHQERIVVPTFAKPLRELVDLLDDTYLESLLDESRCYMTSSKRLVR